MVCITCFSRTRCKQYDLLCTYQLRCVEVTGGHCVCCIGIGCTQRMRQHFAHWFTPTQQHRRSQPHKQPRAPSPCSCRTKPDSTSEKVYLDEQIAAFCAAATPLPPGEPPPPPQQLRCPAAAAAAATAQTQARPCTLRVKLTQPAAAPAAGGWGWCRCRRRCHCCCCRCCRLLLHLLRLGLVVLPGPEALWWLPGGGRKSCINRCRNRNKAQKNEQQHQSKGAARASRRARQHAKHVTTAATWHCCWWLLLLLMMIRGCCCGAGCC